MTCLVEISTILPVVSYGCETWINTLKKKHSLRLFQNKALWKTFGPRRCKVMGAWRKLRKEEVHDFYFSSNIFRMIKLRMEWVGMYRGKERCTQDFGVET
jgi:hypothetical protein